MPSVNDMVTAFFDSFDSRISVIPCRRVVFSRNDKPWMTPILKPLIGYSEGNNLLIIKSQKLES